MTPTVEINKERGLLLVLALSEHQLEMFCVRHQADAERVERPEQLEAAERVYTLPFRDSKLSEKQRNAMRIALASVVANGGRVVPVSADHIRPIK